MSVFQNDSAFSLTGYQRISRRLVSNLPTGVQWEFLYEGTIANLPSLAANLAAKGARVTMELKPGKSTLSALWGFDPGETPESSPATTETPVERYELIYEQVQYSVFNHPKVNAEAERYGSVSEYKALIENAVKNGDPNPLDSGVYPISEILIVGFLARGIDYWDGFRPVIRRTRSFSQTYELNTTPERVSATVKVWTRSALISAFSIPTAFQNRIPEDPSPTDMPLPANSVWGWRIKSFSAGYTDKERKWEESAEWDFAAWNTSLYEVVT